MSEPEAEPRPERAIHLALLAYQTGRIDWAGFREVLDVWAADRSKDIGELLVERGAISGEDRSQLDAIAQRQVAGLGGVPVTLGPHRVPEGAATVADIATRAPGSETEGETQAPPGDPFATLGASSSDAAKAGAGQASGNRYRSIRFHAQGGLGAVFVAIDQELKRNVALKEIQGHRAHLRADRERFVVEAEITGKLEHPGIVPVYGLGTYDDGRPFYAMRFIQGESLETACLAFHARTGQAPSARSLALRGLLRRFLDVCNAVEYAHSRGILHRDLKPGNIMLGKYGETLVVDWGLARVMVKDAPNRAGEDDHGPIDASSLSRSVETLHGSAMGTPGYMSPEQADGALDELGPASDVYSLGATLYVILTGRGPFSGSTSLAEIYRKSRAGEYLPPRALNPDVSRALDAICRKAMAASPEERYPTPRALAEDLEHFLADEPVAARPDAPLDRLTRWARHHRHATVSAALALVSVTVVALAASFLVDVARRSEQQEARYTRSALRAAQEASVRAGASLKAEVAANAKAQEALRATLAANVRAEAALADANRAKALADANFRKAQEAVDDFLTAVSNSRELQLLPDTQAFRRTLLEKARAYYRDFLAGHASEPELQFETGRAHFRLADVVQEIGSKEEAVALYAEALRLIEPLALAHPGSANYQNDLASTLENLANLQDTTGRSTQAEQNYKRTIVLSDQLAREHPGVAAYRDRLASSLNGLASLQNTSNRKAEAEQNYSRAILLGDQLVRDHPDVADYRNRLATAQANLASLQDTLGRAAEAERNYQRAVASYDDLTRRHPKVAGYQSRLAATLANLANLLNTTGRVEQAEQAYEQAITICDQLVRDNPRVAGYQNLLASALGHLARLQAATRRTNRAEQSLNRAIVICDQLVQDNPRVASYQNLLANTLGNLASLQDTSSRTSEAEQNYKQVLAAYETLVRDHPSVADYQGRLASTYTKLAGLLNTTGRKKQAHEHYQKALSICDQLVRDNPNVEGYQHGLATTLNGLANIQAVSHQEAKAAANFQRAIHICDQLVQGNPTNTGSQHLLATTLGNFATLQDSLGHIEPAEQSSIRAISIYEQLIIKNPRLADHRNQLAVILANRARLQTKIGRNAEAEQNYNRAIGILSALVLENPNVIGYQAVLGRAHQNLGLLFGRTGRDADSIQSYQRGIPPLTKAVATEPRNSAYRGWLSNLFLGLSEVHRAAYRPVDALNATRERAKLWPNNPGERFRIVCEFARTIPLLPEDQSEPAAREAIGFLRSAIDVGWKRIDVTATVIDIDPLRHRKDFQALLQELQDRVFPADPFVK